MKINLNKCQKGDILISKHGKAFIYDHKDDKRPYPHVVYDALTGKHEHTRITSGHVMKHSRLDSDDDIVKIIPLNVESKLAEQHRNTRHDAVYVVNEWSTAYIHDNVGKCTELSKLLSDITREIMNLKQRKP